MRKLLGGEGELPVTGSRNLAAYSVKVLHSLTRIMNRAYPRFPVLVEWPNSARVVRHLLNPLHRRLRWQVALRHRKRVEGTTFVCITGSAGKTMAKEMAGAVLRSRYRGSISRGTKNYEDSLPETTLAARPGDRFCVAELGAGDGPGSLCRPIDLLKPAIGVITNIGTDHHSAFGSREAIAAEKGRLVRTLPDDGLAVLNADDPLVMDMRGESRARVVTFGLASGADVRAESISAAWPDRLSFELLYKGNRVLVRTQLCGTQWVPAALAAGTVGLAMGISLNQIARALGTVEPMVGRMSPFFSGGVTFIRDDWKASVHTVPPALEFLRSASAERKVAIIGTLSDYTGSSRMHYVRTARHALEVSDLVVFVGPRSSVALRARPKDEPERLRAFSTVKAAADFLSACLKAGDLVLLKGSNPADHLYRIVHARTHVVSCWSMSCRRTLFCDSCTLIAKPASSTSREKVRDTVSIHHAEGRVLDEASVAGKTMLVGLGNPGDKYSHTPHNVGFSVLDQIAAEANAIWRDMQKARVAVVEWRDIPLCLVKPTAAVNHSGRLLHEMFRQCGIEARQIILVFDDMDLPLGKVRYRKRGSDGGHLGVRSILEAFQTDEFPRVKIGVRREAATDKAINAVLRPFNSAESSIMTSAVNQACSRLQEVITTRQA